MRRREKIRKKRGREIEGGWSTKSEASYLICNGEVGGNVDRVMMVAEAKNDWENIGDAAARQSVQTKRSYYYGS